MIGGRIVPPRNGIVGCREPFFCASAAATSPELCPMQGARSSSLRYCVGDTLPQLEFRTACELLGNPGTHNLPESPLLFDRTARALRSRITRGPRLTLGQVRLRPVLSDSAGNEG